MRAGEESEQSGTGQREELNWAEASIKFSANSTGSSGAGMILLSCPVLRQKGWVFTSPHSELDAGCSQEAGRWHDLERDG